MKNIENQNLKDEKELAKQFDDQLKGLKKSILAGQKDRVEENIDRVEEKKDIENIDKENFKGELDSLKNLIGKNIEKNEINNIEKLSEFSKSIGDKGHLNKSKLEFKYKYDENRQLDINKAIDESASSVDDYILKTPGILGNRMRKIMNTEK